MVQYKSVTVLSVRRRPALPSGISIHVSVIAVKVMSYVNNPGLSLAFQVGGSRYH